MANIEIRENACVVCGACVKSCPFGAISLEENTAVIDETKCVLCGACVDSCKFDAIVLRKTHEVENDFSAYNGVWVFCEQQEGVISTVAYELLSEARKLADRLSVPVGAVLIGDQIKSSAQDIIHRGADTVYVVESPKLKYFNDERYTKIVIDLCEEFKPEIILMGATSAGRALAPRVATLMRTGLTADCTGLDIDDETRMLLQTRPAFGGNIMATILCRDYRPQMATVRHKVFPEAQVDTSRTGEIIEKKYDANSEALKSRTEVLEIVNELSNAVNVADADIIVSAGRGIGTQENLQLVEELADALGGAVGASRAVVDSDWIPYSHQVGQTGKTVCPKVYIACGISGQIQHLVGMQSAKMIIAINSDADAPIFRVATYGIVGDVKEIVPRLTAALKAHASN